MSQNRRGGSRSKNSSRRGQNRNRSGSSNSKSNKQGSGRRRSSGGQNRARNSSDQPSGEGSSKRRNRRPGQGRRSQGRPGRGRGRAASSRYRRGEDPRRQIREPKSIWARIAASFKKKVPVFYRVARVHADEDINLDYMPGIFSRFPELAARLPWVSLRSVESPAKPHRVVRARHLFGENNLWIKNERDDADLMAETSARKLEFVLAHLLANRPKRLVCFDELGSSHALALVQASSLLGLPIEMHLQKAGVSKEAAIDLIEMKNYGAAVHLHASASALNFQLRWAKMMSSWQKTALLLRGAFPARAALGYVSVGYELLSLMEEQALPELDLVVVPMGRGLSYAGFLVGLRLAGLDNVRVLGVPSLGAKTPDSTTIADLANECVELLNGSLDKKLDFRFQASDISIFEPPSSEDRRDEVQRFSQRMMELENFEFEINSTGNSLVGLCEMIKKESIEGKQILFWNSTAGRKSRPLPTASELRNFPAWLRLEYEQKLPSAALRKSKNRKRA